jgi:hypothetical protein
MKELFYAFIILCYIITDGFASEVKIEPMYGVERTQREYPQPARYVTKTYVGLRALWGVPLISAELEIANSTNTEDFPTDNLKVTYKDQRAMLGIRSYLINSKVVGWYGRLGARAKKQTREITEAGVSRTETDDPDFDPYAGTGLTIRMGKLFALNAGATLVHNKNADPSEQYDTQYTFSFTIKAKSK